MHNLSDIPDSEGKPIDRSEGTRFCENDTVDKLLKRKGVAVSFISGREYGHGGCAHCTLQPPGS